MNEIHVIGSRYCSKFELQRAGELVEAGDVEPVVSAVTDLDGTADLLSRIIDNEVVDRGAVTP